MKPLKLLSLNVRGVSLPTSINKIIGIYNKINHFDILLFQETKILTQNQAIHFNQLFDREFKIYHSYASDLGSGVVTLVNKKSFDVCIRIFLCKR
jgi:exonuclease III